MINKIKEKLVSAGKWLKRKATEIVVVVLGIGIALASIYEPTIPEHLQLKCPKEKILNYREVDWKIYDEEGNMIEDKGIGIQYLYISEIEVPALKEEDISKRTKNAQIFPKGKNKEGKEEFVRRFYAGEPFYKDNEKNKWFQTETAITTKEHFKKQTKVSWLDKLLGKEVLAGSGDPIYSGAGDGYLEDWTIPDQGTSQQNWDYSHDKATSNFGDYTRTDSNMIASNSSASNADIYRAFFPFDTSGIPANAIISEVTLSIYVTFVTNLDNDGDDWANVVQTTQPDNTALTTADFDLCGSINNPTEGATRIDLTTLNSDLPEYKIWTLTEATGWDWIKKSGEASTCGTALTGWSCLGMRDGHDAVDHLPVNASNVQIRWSEYADTTFDPYLTVTYTVAERRIMIIE